MADSIVYQQINKDHAYWSEKRSVGQARGGNTAGLLTHKQGDRALTSLLFDAGLGTIDGLHDLGAFSWQWPLEVFLTHGHIDHHAELMILSELWCKRESTVMRRPLTVRCTGETFECIRPVHSHGFGSGNTLSHARLTPGRAVDAGIFRVHPISVDHFPGSVVYVVEAGKHKIVIGWDMKTLPDPDEFPILREASLALLEANTWTALSGRTGHTSVEELVNNGSFRFIDSLRVKPPRDDLDHYGIYLVHYGGAEDPGGAVSDSRLADKFNGTFPELAPLVGVARRGQSWTFRL